MGAKSGGVQILSELHCSMYTVAQYLNNIPKFSLYSPTICEKDIECVAGLERELTIVIWGELLDFPSFLLLEWTSSSISGPEPG